VATLANPSAITSPSDGETNKVASYATLGITVVSADRMTAPYAIARANARAEATRSLRTAAVGYDLGGSVESAQRSLCDVAELLHSALIASSSSIMAPSSAARHPRWPTLPVSRLSARGRKPCRRSS